MSNATGTNPAPKRTRLSETQTEPTTTTTAPTAAAKAALISALASLTPLWKPLVEPVVAKLISIHAKIRQKEKTLLAFDNPLFIPRSARIGFTLTGSSQVRESPRFKELAAAADITVTNSQQELMGTRNAQRRQLEMLKEDKAKAILSAIVDFAKFEATCNAKDPTSDRILPYCLPGMNAELIHALHAIGPADVRQFLRNTINASFPPTKTLSEEVQERFIALRPRSR
jgi:hypothetical protein